jgi:hypothetical protein
MNIVRALYAWTVRNFANIFSVIGIILTLCLSVFYVPDWIRKNENEKIKNAEISLQQSIKELAYSDSSFTYQTVDVLIQAKEQEINEKLPFSINQILTGAQGSFMEDKFLPLSVRKHLVDKIERIKPTQNNKPKIDTITSGKGLKSRQKTSFIDNLRVWVLGNDDHPKISNWPLVVLAILGAILGFISLYTKIRTEKENQEEVSNEIKESENSSFEIVSSKEYEKAVIKAILKHPGVETVDIEPLSNPGFDLIFKLNNKVHFVEIKYLTQSSVGLGSFERFISKVANLEGEFWFIYNTGITTLVRKKSLEQKNKNIELIHAPSIYVLNKKLSKLMKREE